MPFTPFHWGLPLLIADLGWKRERTYIVQILSVILVTIPDIEGFSALTLGISWIPVHGPLHSILGALSLGVVFSITAKVILDRYRIQLDRKDLAFLLITPLIFHLGLDIMMHRDICPFWPFSSEPNELTIPRGGYLSTLTGIIAFEFYVIIQMARYMNRYRKRLRENTNKFHGLEP